MNLLRFVIGMISGVVATGPMTVAMIRLHRWLPVAERYPLPPREIAMKLAATVGLHRNLAPETRSAATLLAHFGYGAFAGGVYAAAAEKFRVNGVCKGLIFGLLVWSVSYLGLLPGAGVLSPATDHPARRNALMIAAHVVWGVTLGWLVEVFLAENEQRATPPLSTSPRFHRDVA